LIQKIKFILKSNSFIRNTSLLASGILLSQIISIVSSPLISRIYTPSDFGALHIFLSFITILTVISTLKFELAIPLPEEDETAFYLLMASVVFVSVFSALIAIALYLFKPIIINWFDLKRISDYFYLIPIGIFFAGVYLILNYWAIRKKKFNLIAKTKIKQATFGVGTQIGLGLLGVKPLGLLIGAIFKRASGFIALSKLVLEDKHFFTQLTVKKLNFVIKRYKKFPLISSQSALLNVLGLNLPILLLAHFYGSKKVGFFSLTLLVVNVPLTTLGRSLSQVFISESSELIKTDIKKLKKLYLKIIRNLLIIGIIPCLILILWAPVLFPFIFGDGWHLSGKITQNLAIMYLIQFVTVPTSQLLTIMENQEIQLIWDALRLLAVFISIYIPFLIGSSFLITVTYYGLTMSIMYGILLLIQIFYLNKTISTNA